MFALVLGLLAFLYLIATTLLLCAEANVVGAMLEICGSAWDGAYLPG